MNKAYNEKHIFKMEKRMKHEHQNIIGEKCVKDDNNILAFDEESKRITWKNHYDKLLNTEFQ